MLDPVAQRFSRAADRYDQAARIQQEAARCFDAWLAERGLEAPARIAEIGCGTGMFSALLRQRYPHARLLATDLAPAMVERCRARLGEDGQTSFAVCDGRDAVFDPAPDWVVSAMCFQWFDALPPVLRHHLGQCEVLAFSLMLEGSFAEWRRAHEAAGEQAGLRVFPAFESVRDACQALGAARVHADRISLRETHADGLSFARGLRAIGADQPRPGRAPARLGRVLRRLEHGWTANYEIGFFCLIK